MVNYDKIPMMNKNLLLISLTLTMISCKKDNYVTEFYANGNIKLKVQIDKDSIQNGTYEEFYDSGELKSKTNYINGKISDSLFNFYKNGTVKEKGITKDNNRDSWWLYFRPSGTLKEKSEFITVNNESYKNQSIYYDNKGSIKIEPSTFFELEISDTLIIGKNGARIKNYVTHYNNRERNFITVIVDNKYSESETRKDTFGDGTFTPFFGITTSKLGKQKIIGKIQEKVVTVVKDSMHSEYLEIMEHYKYFEKEVYVSDIETETAKKLREEMIANSKNN